MNARIRKFHVMSAVVAVMATALTSCAHADSTVTASKEYVNRKVAAALDSVGVAMEDQWTATTNVISASSASATNYVDSATNDVLVAAQGYTDEKISEIPAADFSTNNIELVETIEATAPPPGDYAAVSNAAVYAAITNTLQDAAIASLASSVSMASTSATNYVDSATNEVLSAAQGYTDSRISEIPPPANYANVSNAAMNAASRVNPTITNIVKLVGGNAHWELNGNQTGWYFMDSNGNAYRIELNSDSYATSNNVGGANNVLLASRKWVDDRLAGKASTADATLAERGFSAWTIFRNGVNVTDQILELPSFIGNEDTPDWDVANSYIQSDSTLPKDGETHAPENTHTLSWAAYDDHDDYAKIQYTATREALQGYILGSQTNKVLASEAEAEALRTGKQSALTAQQLANIAAVSDALAFDATHSYAAGDPVVYNGTLYTFTSAHTGAWTGSDVSAVDIIAMLAGKLDKTTFVAPFSAGATYEVGMRCVYNNTIYRCTTFHDAMPWNPSDFVVDESTIGFLRDTGGVVSGRLTVNESGYAHGGVIIEGNDYYAAKIMMGIDSGGIIGLFNNGAIYAFAFKSAGSDVGCVLTLDDTPIVTEGSAAHKSKLDSTSAAPAFSTSSTYAVDEHVTYNGKLYRCTTAVATAGAWTGDTNWTEATVEDVLAALRTGKANRAANPTAGNLAALDANGNPTDSTIPVANVVTKVDISGVVVAPDYNNTNNHFYATASDATSALAGFGGVGTNTWTTTRSGIGYLRMVGPQANGPTVRLYINAVDDNHRLFVWGASGNDMVVPVFLNAGDSIKLVVSGSSPLSYVQLSMFYTGPEPAVVSPSSSGGDDRYRPDIVTPAEPEP